MNKKNNQSVNNVDKQINQQATLPQGNGGCCGDSNNKHGSSNTDLDVKKSPNTGKLIISWQRLVSEGDTCPRCGSTEDELDKAVEQLNKIFSPLGITVELQKIELTLEEFKREPIKSNTIRFNGIALEDLIEAKTGKSQCCDVCGNEECRTLEVGGQSLEIIPADIIIKAGMIAGAKL